MSDENMAANTESSVENANSEQTEVTTQVSEGQANTEVVTEGATQETKVEDVTKTQAFAHRLKEETARIKQAERDAYVAEQGYTWNGKPITTEAEHRQALNEQAEYERRESLQKQGIDPSIVDKYVAENSTVKWAEEFKSQQEAKAFVDKNRVDFLTYYKMENSRPFDTEKDILPESVWKQTELYEQTRGKEGKSLSDAYAYHAIQQLKAENAELKAKAKAQETNVNNAASSPGSVTGNGTNPNEYFTADQVKSMTPAQVKHHFNAIEESMKRWK
jgi:hypothetical protein